LVVSLPVAPVPGGLAADPLRYVFAVTPAANDMEYQQALAVRSMHSHSFSRLDGLFGAVGLMVALLMLRFLWNNAFAALMRSQNSSKEHQQVVNKMEEEIWMCIGGMLLLVTGWQCLYSVSGYCGLHNTTGCLQEWPLIPIEPNVHKYYNIELGWYLHLMLKHVLGLGLQDNSTMGAHHIATVALVLLSYMLNVHLLGLMVFGLLNVSSPLLHLSKLASTLEYKKTKTVLFATFAVVFFMTRCVVFPYIIIKSAMYDPLLTVRGVLQYFMPFYLLCNVLLLVLCVMQGVWFRAIVRILNAGLRGSHKQLQHEIAAANAADRRKQAQRSN
jgi:ceramide synthetase